MAIPKQPILADPTPDIQGVPGPDGVLTTAVTPPSPQPPVPPTPPAGVGGATGAPGGTGAAPVDFSTPEGFAAFVAQQAAAGPAQASATGEFPTPEERILQAQEAATRPTGFGQFAPRDIAERADVLAGGFDRPFQAGLSDSLMGWLFRSSPGTARNRDRATAELINYSAQNPWSSVLGQIAGGFVGDAPLEVVLALGTLSIGEGIVLAAQASGRGASSLRNLAAGVQRLKRAYRLNAGRSISRLGFKRALARGAFETSLGVLSGATSEALQQALGKEGDFSDIAFRAALDGLASAPFAEALRFGGKVLRLTRRTIGRRLARVVAEDTPGVKADDLEAPFIRALDESENVARFRREDARARPIDDGPPIELSARAAADVNRLVNRFNRKPTGKNLMRALGELVEGPDATARRVQAQRVVDVVVRRARAAGMSIDDYLAAKRLRLNVQNRPSQIINNANNIIAAPARATSVSDLFHEVGHLIFADLNDAQRNAAKKFLGVSPDRQLAREDYEEFADAFVRFLDTGTAKNRPTKRMFQRVLDWFRSVYQRLTRRPPAEDIDDLFRKMIPEDGTRIEEPFAVPSLERELVEARTRAEAGLEQLFARPRRKRRAIQKTKPGLTDQQREDIAARQQQLKQEAQDAADSFDASPWIPRTRGGETLAKVQKNSPRALYADNVSLYSYSDRLGPGFKPLKKKIRKSLTTAARVQNKMILGFRDDIRKAGLNLENAAKLKEASDLTVQTPDGPKTMNMTELQKMKLYMYAIDGFDASRKEVTRNAAQKSLTFSKGGFVNPNKPKERIVLTPDELKRLQTGEFLTPEAKAVADAIVKNYRTIVPFANKFSNDLFGSNILSPDNVHYNPKVTRARENNDESNIVTAALLGDKKALALLDKGNLRARSGEAPLLIVNPIEEFQRYVNRTVTQIANAEVIAQYKVSLETAGPEIEHAFGKNVLDALDDLVKINSGDTGPLGTASEAGLINRLFSVGVMGKLGWNPSVIGKQFASAMTVAAAHKMNTDGVQMAKDAVEILFNNSLRRELLDEMAEKMPFMAKRMREQIQIIEFDNAVAGLSDIQFMFGNLTVADSIKLAKKGVIKGTDAAINNLQKTTRGIVLADESTLASIWKNLKKEVALENEYVPGSQKFFNEVEDRFMDIVLETQPTVDPTSRSLNQMKRGIGFKFFTMFSTQTRKNWELWDKEFSRWLNIENRTPEDNRRLVKTIIPLALQTAYVTAVGAGVSFTINQALKIFQSEQRQRQLARRQESATAKIFADTMRNLLGQRPVIGKLSADLVNAMFGVKPFEQAIPIIDEIHKFSEGVSERSARKTLDGVQQLLGVPTVIRRPISETAGRVQENTR